MCVSCGGPGQPGEDVRMRPSPMHGQENNAQLCLRLGERQVTKIGWNLEPGNRHLTSLSFKVKMQEVPLG